ncbi:MAG: acylphosphatase [Deltaproteobacteria bacterium]|nr:acylphosphatase [Deltaproteobacteria bacterium]
MKQRVRVVVTGRVQGVFFRAETQRQALSLNIRGWVRNLPGGSVEALFEGTKEDVDRMIAWCRKGPRLASVDTFDINFEPYKGDLDGFIISY